WGPCPGGGARQPNGGGLTPLTRHTAGGGVPPVLGGYIAAHGRKIVMAAAGLTLAGGAAGLTPSIMGTGPSHASTGPVPVYSQRGDTATPLTPLHAPSSGSWRGGGLITPKASPAAAPGGAGVIASH